METRSPEKRKVSARLKAEDPSTAEKKTKVRKIYARKSTTGVASSAKDPATPRSNNSASPAPLPSRLAKDSPLPTAVAEKPEGQHAAKAKSPALQSIAESGVLASSLTRSRTRWITAGIFERYWTKPRTHKGVVSEPPNNPPKGSMTKLGRCRIIVEPHILEATLYTICDIYKPAVSQPVQQQPKPISNQPPPVQTPLPPQQTPTVAASPISKPSPATAPPLQPSVQPPSATSSAPGQQTTASSPGPAQPAPTPATAPASSPSAPVSSAPVSSAPVSSAPVSSAAANSAQAPSAKASPAAPTKQSSSPQPTQTSPNVRPPPPSQNQQPVQQRQYSKPQVQPSSQAPKPPAPTQQDPVILMLAQRASSDPDLKVLMRIVASGQASKEQLAVFQKHIDELTAIIARHNQQQAAQAAQTSQRTPAQYPSRPAQPFTQPKPMSFAYDPAHHTQPKFKAQPLARIDITGACMEFDASGTSDRLLFPKQAIIEYAPGSLVAKASFFVIRRGDNSSPGYELGKSYYQPVTIHITSDNPRFLEPLTRVVAPADEVRKHMTETMEKLRRAPRNDLVLQLPAAEGDESETPLTPAALDRKANLKSLPASMLTPTGRVKKNALVDDLDHSCQYCYASGEGMLKGDDGQFICPSCNVLREKELAVSRPLVVRAAPRHISGPKALAFAA